MALAAVCPQAAVAGVGGQQLPQVGGFVLAAGLRTISPALTASRSAAEMMVWI